MWLISRLKSVQYELQGLATFENMAQQNKETLMVQLED
jgi:hypothetical protein